MGNSGSQPSYRRKSPCLLYFIHRAWKIILSSRGIVDREEREFDDTDGETDFSSKCCRGCHGCRYHQDFMFDSESEMAPNAEEDLLVVSPAGSHHAEKERLRPPTYNAEDYAIALRRWGRRPLGTQESQGTLPSTCTSSSSGYASGNGEMTLRQFTSVSELLNKLRADLRLAFPSFVQEFASAPAEGISLLLETLRGIQLAQMTPPSGQTGRRVRTRRAALDELGCVECLAACGERCADAPRLLAKAQPGLLALAVCLTSSLNRSRVLALQLLTRVCQAPGGHLAVSEAVSTMRLRFGEGGRFRFLAGALLAPKAALALRVAGVSFLNAFLKSAPRAQSKFYIQAEACEAGLEPRVLHEWLKVNHEDVELSDLLRQEVQKWTQQCVDVDALQGRAQRAEETCRVLSKKVTALQRQLQKLQLERLNDINDQNRRDQQRKSHRPLVEKKVSSSAEDEGISFSERSSSPEDPNNRNPGRSIENDQETTIDDVIEELRIIVKDAENELEDWNQIKKSPEIQKVDAAKKDRMTAYVFGMDRPIPDQAKRKDSLKIVVRQTEEQESDENEAAIVPAIIHPQPPRRTSPCIASAMFLRSNSRDLSNTKNSREEEQEDETLGDGSDSLLSASRLNYNNKCQLLAGSSVDNLDNLVDFEISETILSPRKLESNSLGSRQFSKCSNSIQRRTERRKYLRRSQSQDPIEPNDSCSLRSRVSSGGIVERIRKFESLTSFDERRSLPHEESSRLRRSESFHQTHALGAKDSYASRSESELTYVQNGDKAQPKSLTKSLDRIDEGLDSIIDIVVSDDKRHSRRRLSSDCEDRHALRGEKSTGNQQTVYDVFRRQRHGFGDTASRPEPERNFTTFYSTERSMRHGESPIFSGRPHDVLGFGKSRFNAGKYSGNHPHLVKNTPRAPTNTALHCHRGKVTDVLSGLY